MKKRLLSAFLAFALLCALLPRIAFVAVAETQSGSCGSGAVWSLDLGSGILTVTGSGKMSDYSRVASMRAPWYDYRYYITSAIISKGVMNVGDYAFFECSSLTSVEIQNTVTTIGDYAFANCSSLVTLKLPDSLTSIENNAFNKCMLLASVEIPDSVRTVGNYAFDGCTSLAAVKLSKRLETLGNSAFASTAVESVEIPKSLDKCLCTGTYNFKFNGTDRTVPSGPFSNCGLLTGVAFEEGTTQIAEGLFAGCISLSSVIIPDDVTDIEDHAFDGCVALTSVNIPDSVTTIGKYSFNGCVSLLKVDIPDSVRTIGDRAFGGCSSLSKVKLSKMLETLGGGAFDSVAIQEIEIPASLDKCASVGSEKYVFNETDYSIPIGPFCCCDGLKKVTFEKGTTQIAKDLFSGCTGIERIVIPDTVVAIEENAFRGCLRLSSVVIPAGVTTVGKLAFNTCVSLDNVILPDKAADIGVQAFAECSSLKTLKLPKTAESIAASAFRNCTSLTEVEIPTSVTVIQERAFSGCTALETYTFENKKSELREFGRYAFCDCAALEKAVMPDSLTAIGVNAFQNCASLKEAILPENVKTVGEYAFQGCLSLKKVYLPETTKTLGKYAFQGDEALSSVTLSDYGVTKIDECTFKDCPSLASIVLPKGLAEIGSQAFMNDTALFTVTIPESVNLIDGSAFSYPDKTVIRGKPGSYAETFVKNNNFKSFVKDHVAAEKISPARGIGIITMHVGDTYRAVSKVVPENANDVITITADSKKIAVNGRDITAKSVGDFVMTATASSGASYVFKIHVMSDKPTSRMLFEDVVAGAYYEEAVRWAVELNITTGTTKKTFSPNNECTRAQVVTFLWRTAGSPEPESTKNPFTDVKPTAYCYKAVLWAIENNITAGLTKTEFGPDKECTRGQVVTFLWRAKGEPATSKIEPSFKDVNKDGYYYTAMLWAVSNGITNGTTAATFAPDATCTRGQVVTFLHRSFR